MNFEIDDQVWKRFQVKLFCAYHKPNGIYWNYHRILLTIIVANCFVINMMCDIIHSTQFLIKLMIFFDCILLTIFILEFCIRLFTIQVVAEYRGYRGLVTYLKHYLIGRFFDLFSIFTFLAFIILQSISKHDKHFTTLRILHFLQVFHFFRLYSKIFKLFMKVVYENRRLLITCVILYIIEHILLSLSVYFIEMHTNPKFNNILNALWFGFQTLTTIGHGDILAETDASKILIAVFTILSYCMFSVPATIIGSSLAMGNYERRQRAFCFEPAANLIQKTWRNYAIQRVSGFWHKHVMGNSGNSNRLSTRDKYAIMFICKLSFFTSLNRFKYSSLVEATETPPLQYVDLQRRIELMNRNIRQHKSNMELIAHKMALIKLELQRCLELKRNRKKE